MTLDQIDRLIQRLEAQRNAATGHERQKLDDAILQALRDRMDIAREQQERDIDCGLREQSAWYDVANETAYGATQRLSFSIRVF
jgi:hypothetical protein